MATSLSVLYRKYADWLRARARSMGASDPEDLAQAAFLRLSEGDRQDVQHPKALLATITRNLSRDSGRTMRAQGGPALAFDELAIAVSPRVQADQDSALLLKQVILALPPIYRDTFILNRFVGMTYAEIADRQGITVKAVEYRMSRALALCQEALRD